MRKSILLTILASGITFTGITFGQTPPSGTPAGPSGGGSTVQILIPQQTSGGASAGTVSTTVITVPTTPTVNKPNMTAILKGQAGKVNATRGSGSNVKPSYQNRAKRNSGVNPTPGLGASAMRAAGIGKFTGKLGRSGGGNRYERRMVKRRIGIGKVPRATGSADENDDESEDKKTYDILGKLSDSGTFDLLTTEAVPKELDLAVAAENAQNNIKEKVDEGLLDTGGDNYVDDILGSFGGLPEKNILGDGAFSEGLGRNNGNFTAEGLDGMYGDYSQGVGTRVGGNAGRGDMSLGWAVTTDSKGNNITVVVMTLSEYNKGYNTDFKSRADAEDAYNASYGGNGSPGHRSVGIIAEDGADTKEMATAIAGMNDGQNAGYERSDVGLVYGRIEGKIGDGGEFRGLDRITETTPDDRSTAADGAAGGSAADGAAGGSAADGAIHGSGQENEEMTFTPEEAEGDDGGSGQENEEMTFTPEEAEGDDGKDGETDEERKERERKEAEAAAAAAKMAGEGAAGGRQALGESSSESLNGPASMRSYWGDKIQGKSPAGNTIRLGGSDSDNGSIRGPLNQGSVTKIGSRSKNAGLRIDPNSVMNGSISLLESKLNNNHIRFGGDNGEDPRSKPKPTGGGGAPIGGGNGPVAKGAALNFNSMPAKTTSTPAEVSTEIKGKVQGLKLNAPAKID